MGWVAARHGVLYAEEFGWDWRFEAMVARVAADFIDRFEPGREAGWIAERTAGTVPGDDPRLGSVLLVQARDETTGRINRGTAQLRLLLLEPSARGLGLGRRLVNECEAFARSAGYKRIRLWTQSNLLAARALYASAGYRLVATEPHRSFGKRLVGENWEMAL